MTTSKLSAAGAPLFSSGYLGAWREIHPSWYFCTIGYTLLAVLCLFAPLFDDRLLHGVSVWTKPFKFALSLAVYFGTLVVFAQYTPKHFFSTWSGRTLTTIPLICALFEMIYITVQGALGEPSHFNRSTPFHATMYSLMGAGATLLVLVLAGLAWIIARANSLYEPLILAIVLGLILTLVLGGGFGGYLGNQGSHWVNATQSDATGSPLFGWARDGGDLRVAHFFGMHAMQILPMFVLLLPKRWSQTLRVSVVVVFAIGYSALSVLTFYQAIQGQPFLSTII